MLEIILNLVPLYMLGRTAFLVVLFHPKAKGASFFYDKVMAPLFKKYGH